jgi:hypothetical protein
MNFACYDYMFLKLYIYIFSSIRAMFPFVFKGCLISFQSVYFEFKGHLVFYMILCSVYCACGNVGI